MRLFYLVLLLAVSLSVFSLQAAAKIDSNTFGGLEARPIGPAVMGGRIEAIDAVASDPRVIYIGAASGGVWKSINGGTSFKPVFDKYVQSIGAIAIDQTHPDTVWVGSGESDTRNSVSVGTGIYKTTDAGENWQMMGLEKSERISKIVIDPKNSDTVYLAVPGHLWESSEDRGVYKTTDGGKTWTKILYVNADTGCADLAIDPQNPQNVYAAMWQFRRKPYFFTSGGPGSGFYKTSDGGKTWKKISKGLPAGDLGRIALAIAPSKPNVLYANVEAKQTGLYRSEDSGESWNFVNRSFNVEIRPFYFSHLAVDPKDPNRLYKPGFFLSASSDGGQSFGDFGNIHPDEHAIWIDPTNSLHLLIGTDGGVFTSYDKGNTWRYLNNIPVSQFYHVTYDMQQPYHVYGGLQDNNSWEGPSQGSNGVQGRDWKTVGFGDGFWTVPDPIDSDVIYSEAQGGEIMKFSRKTGEVKLIKPYPANGESKFRFNWNTPIVINPKNTKTLYLGGQFLFRSTNQGESWEKISPDLTTNDPAKQKQEDSGGLTIDNSTAENHCTIFAISASPLDENVIWVGTDDGNVQVTRDNGKTWTNVTANVAGLPKATWVSSIEAGHYDAGTAYATFDNHQTGDMKTYVYRTTDFGKTWKSISTDSMKGYAHVIREDLVNRNLLFLGTEMGLFLSVDGGEQWGQFTGKLPNVSVRDLAIQPRESDLIIATHGRGVWILDDLTPLRSITSQVLESKVAMLPSRPSVIKGISIEPDFGGDGEYVGQSVPEVANITYYLKERHVFGDIKMEIYDADGKLLATLPAGKRRGINRVQWAMRLKPPKVPPSADSLTANFIVGPTVPEGTYMAKLIDGNQTYTTQIQLVADPRFPHSAADRKAQQETAMKLYRMQQKLGFVAEAIADGRDQANDRAKKLKKGDSLAKALTDFANRLDNLRKTLVATKPGYLTGEEQLKERMLDVYLGIIVYSGHPSDSQLARMDVLQKQLESSIASFDSIVKKDLENLNKRLQQKKLDPMKILSEDDYNKKEAA